MDDFGTLLYAEIDYVAEAANARRFSELYAQEMADVFVPKVYSELTTRKVLTMEWVDGFRLTDRESLEAYNLDREKLVNTLVQCSLRQIMENGFFHAGGFKYQQLSLFSFPLEIKSHICSFFIITHFPSQILTQATSLPPPMEDSAILTLE